MKSEQFVAVRRSAARGWLFLRQTGGWRLDAFGVALALLLVQLLLVTLSGVRSMGATMLERGALHLEVSAGTTDQRVQELYAALRGLPAVQSVTYVTREQVLVEEQARDASLGAFLERYGIENPFADTFVVVPRDSGSYDDLRTFVQDESGSDGIDASVLSQIAAQEASTRQMLGVVETARAGVELLVLLSGAIAGLLSLNLLLRLVAARGDIIAAEAVAGATTGVLSLPGVSAGVLALLGSLAVATILSALVVIILAFVPSSAAIGQWITGAFIAGLLPLAPIVLCFEAALLAALAWAVGRGAVSTPFRP